MLLGLAAQYMAKPKEIDPQEVYDLGTSPYNKEMYNRSQDLVDYNSELNRKQFDHMNEAVQDNTYTANRISKQNQLSSGMGNQSGILQSAMKDNTMKGNDQLLKNYNSYVSNNMAMSNNLMGTATANDMKARDNMVSAYGQNITNQNNWTSAMAGNITKISNMPMDLLTGGGSSSAAGAGGGSGAPSWLTGAAGLVTCDANMKENIKKIGTVPTKDGKKVGLFNYNYKGSKKPKTGVIAQDIMQTHPKAVHKGKNGRLYVNLKDLF